MRRGEEPQGGFDSAVIAQERSDAADWVKAYQQYEDALVRDGKDDTVEAAYAPFYAEHGRTLKTRDFFMTECFYLDEVGHQLHNFDCVCGGRFDPFHLPVVETKARSQT